MVSPPSPPDVSPVPYREWQADRVKLVHCIHLQQLELTQRAMASHEKATDIAKVSSVCTDL